MARDRPPPPPLRLRLRTRVKICLFFGVPMANPWWKYQTRLAQRGAARCACCTILHSLDSQCAQSAFCLFGRAWRGELPGKLGAVREHDVLRYFGVRFFGGGVRPSSDNPLLRKCHARLWNISVPPYPVPLAPCDAGADTASYLLQVCTASGLAVAKSSKPRVFPFRPVLGLCFGGTPKTVADLLKVETV